MKKIRWIFLSISLFFLTGCYNYRELNQLAIMSAIGIDKTENGYQITVQIMDTKKQDSGNNTSGQPKFTIYKQEGRSLQEAMRNVILESPKRLYGDHLELMVISEELAREGIHDILDFFFRDSEVRKQFLILISNGQPAEDVLSIILPIEPLNAKNIKESVIADSKYLGVSEKQNFEDILGDYLNDKVELTMAGVQMIGNKEEGEEEDNIKESTPNTRVVLTPVAIFKKDKMLDFVEEQQSIAISFILNKVKNTIVTKECGDKKYLSVEIIGNKTNIKAENGKPKVTLSLKSKGNINEISCDLNLQDEKVIEQIKKDIEQEIGDNIRNTIHNLTEKYDTDIFGFEDAFYRSNPKYYKKLLEEQGDNFLKNLEVEVKVNVELQAKGSARKVIKNE